MPESSSRAPRSPALELLFGNTAAFVLRGGDSRDIAEVIDVLESWLTLP